MKFDEIIKINGKELTKKYIESLSSQERIDLIDPIFDLLRSNGFIFPDDGSAVNKSWKRLLEHKPDLTTMSLYNNSSLATDICKFFCHSFYRVTDKNKPNMIDNFNNDDVLKRIIKNRLGLDWYYSDSNGPGVNEAFNLSFKMIVFQGQRSMRLVPATSMFKPDIAKYMAMRYSNENDLIFDPSCGFGGRLLGTIASGRRFVGTDPMTTFELNEMANYLNFDKNRYKLIESGSENWRGDENSIDFSWSSPPYMSKSMKVPTEYYCDDKNQAYAFGWDHFINVYWKGTLENIKHMLKPGSWFGLNVKDCPEMVDMAQYYFGDVIEKVILRTVRSHLTKNENNPSQKEEYIYMFKNIK